MGALAGDTQIIEYTLDSRAEDIVENLLELEPQIIGFGVYIWNAVETLAVVRLLKQLQPSLIISLGGPEVSFEMDRQQICELADYVLPGQSELTFAELCVDLLAGNSPVNKIQSSLPLSLEKLTLPYAEYTDEDIAHRVIYVEASRGCPFKCEFCLSSLDKTATPFPLDQFLQELQSLIDRGARQFKFVDRTFNLKVESCCRILDFFLANLHDDLFLHFELIPDRLPTRLREKLPQFPAGMLQFEIGIQSFDPEVQALVSRRQNMQKTCDNLRWLRANTSAHIHADLIFGLPGETLQSFGEGFDQLCELDPQEIQVGLLKRLRGTPIDRHTEPFSMVYQQHPPYRVMRTSTVDFVTMQRMARFARYWDLIANSGRFVNSLPLMLGARPFDYFLALSDWLYAETGQTHRISLQRLFKLIHRGALLANPALLDTESIEAERNFEDSLLADFSTSGLKGRAPFAQVADQQKCPPTKTTSQHELLAKAGSSSAATRQRRHLTH